MLTPRDKFPDGGSIFAKNFDSCPTWLPGVIKKVQGPVSYTVTLTDG